MLKLFLLLLIICYIPAITYSQSISSSTKINQLTDQQMLQLWQEAQKNGLSESDAMKLLVKKGLSSSDVNNFKRRLLDIQTNSKLNKGEGLNLIQDSTTFLRDSSWVVEVPLSRKKKLIYGLDLFSNANVSFEPNLRLATPKNYIIGPDDELVINVTGLNETSMRLKVTPEGNIKVPYAGIIVVAGLTIDEATKLIKQKLQQKVYTALKNGQSQILVTLANVKTIRVTVIGEAARPGGYSVSSLSSFINVLYLSGGPTEQGSLRNIEIIRQNKVIATIDLYPFLQKGILSNDIRLEDQDIIRYPVYNKHVYITGAIKRPAIYELAQKETLQDLIKLSGGFNDTAFTKSLKVTQLDEQGKILKDISSKEFDYYLPHNGDSIYVAKIIPIVQNDLVITGAVNYPGHYGFTTGMMLTDLIKKANYLANHALPEKGLVKRITENNTRAIIAFNLSDIEKNQSPNIPLAKEDSVYIPFADSLQTQLTVTIAGFVRNPGTYLYRAGMTASDIITIAGGFSFDAAQHRVDISRLTKNKSDTLANQLTNIIRINFDSSNTTDKSFLLEPLDYINVPQLLNYHSLGNVKIRGEVLFPGDFILERRDEQVYDLIKIAGGLTPYGSLSDLQVYRKGLRVSLNFLENSETNNQKLFLQANDSIYIPRSQPFVEVMGAVFNPQILNYQGSRFLSYISSVGGITDKGSLKHAYIQYSNGINRKIKHFLFFRSYPKVKPGSKIVVPQSNNVIGGRAVTISEVATILTSLTALVTIIRLL